MGAEQREGGGEARERLRAWLHEVMGRLDPARLRIEPGETLGQAVARVFDLEEQRVRTSKEDPALLHVKLEALAELRRSFPLTSPEDSQAATREALHEPATPQQEGSMSQESEARPPEATFELAMDGIEEVPMARLADLVELWGRVVDGIGTAAKIPERFRQEYRRVEISVASGENGRELVAWFRGARDMVVAFRGYLREMGIESS